VSEETQILGLAAARHENAETAAHATVIATWGAAAHGAFRNGNPRRLCIHGPVGLALGTACAREIATAILAEIIAVRPGAA
jgi:xanthine/CO dehydrogenase XdhC/CoxF family maturation factor